MTKHFLFVIGSKPEEWTMDTPWMRFWAKVWSILILRSDFYVEMQVRSGKGAVRYYSFVTTTFVCSAPRVYHLEMWVKVKHRNFSWLADSEVTLVAICVIHLSLHERRFAGKLRACLNKRGHDSFSIGLHLTSLRTRSKCTKLVLWQRPLAIYDRKQ